MKKKKDNKSSDCDFVLNKILNAEVSEDPWKHLIIRDFLPNSLYNGVKEEVSFYIENPALKRKNVAAYHIFANESMGVMPDRPKRGGRCVDNLLEYYNILLDESIINAIKRKLSVSQHPKDFYSELNLFTQGYVYGAVHPDTSTKAITMLHYLAEKGDDESLGTFLYTPYKDGNELDVFKDKVASAPYISNCVLLFAPCDSHDLKTNHCMANNSDKTFLRSSFQTFWMKKEKDWTKDQPNKIKL